MKIGLVLPGFSADERDWCIPALLNLVRNLANHHSVHVFALEYPYRRATYSVYGATVHSLGGRNRGKAYAPRLWQTALSAIYAEHRRAPFELLHSFWVNEPGAIALFAGKALEVPVVASAAGGELVGIPSIRYGGQLNRFERSMVNIVMRSSDQVTVGSRYMQHLAWRWRPDAALLPLGVDTQRFAPGENEKRDGSQTILNIGSLVQVKHQTELLDAFAQLGMPHTRLKIIGRGHLTHHLDEHARMLGIADRVVWLGEVPHDELAEQYSSADLLVQSSLHEAQGMAVLEAAACGTPLAGTPVGVLPELAKAGAAAAAVGFRAEDICEAMVRALRAGNRPGNRARDTVKQCFSLEETQNQWTDLYSQILHR